jgi:tRNA(His) 5'-end guanylyltransferase
MGATMPPEDEKKELQEWLTQSTKIQEVVLKAAEVISSRIQETQKVWEEALRPFAAQVEKFQNFFQESLGPFLQQVAKAFKELPPHAQRAVLTLASHGWFFDLDMTPSELWRLSEAFSNNEEAKAEEELADYFESRVVEIKNNVIERFPKRKACLDEAFLAHLNGYYYLSIPVLLAQTDGICKEAVGHHLFIKNRKD